MASSNRVSLRASRMVVVSIAATLLAVSTPANAQGISERDAVWSVVQSFFDGMHARDTSALSAAVLPGIQMLNPIRKGEALTLRVLDVNRFHKLVLETLEPYHEVMHDPEVRIDGDLATVWGRYTFRVGERVTNCGANSIQLLKTVAGWKIASIASTIEITGCEEPRLFRRRDE